MRFGMRGMDRNIAGSAPVSVAPLVASSVRGTENIIASLLSGHLLAFEPGEMDDHFGVRGDTQGRTRLLTPMIRYGKGGPESVRWK